MKMIIGGAFQGKTDFVKEHFKLSDVDVLDGEKCDFNAVFAAKCVNNYHALIRRIIEEKIEPIEFTERLCRENPDIIIITNEIGSGIIPLEKDERIWREYAGRAGCIIAKNSELVVRVFCGVAEVIKGEPR